MLGTLLDTPASPSCLELQVVAAKVGGWIRGGLECPLRSGGFDSRSKVESLRILSRKDVS